MGLTKEDKMELARQVVHLKELGYSKTKAVEKLHKAYLWKKRTIAVYWETFKDLKGEAEKN